MRSHVFAKTVALIGMFALALAIAGCKKKEVAQPPAPPPPPPPAPTAPTVRLQASLTTVERGRSVTLSWTATDATEVNLSGVGAVAAQGSTDVTPAASTTYSITATGPGGTANDSVRITVNEPPPPPPPPAPAPTIEELFRANVFDGFFDYDKADVRPDARDALTKTAQFLRSYPQVRVTIEGHCDERGSTEYNLSLGERRAQAARDFLVQLGIPADRVETVSWGKERPFCTQSNEDCWQLNRRAHFVMIP